MNEFGNMKSKSKKQNKDNRQSKYNLKVGFCYSFFTLVLLFCLIQVGYGAILNMTKIISYKAKIITLENLLKNAKLRNQDLKSEKKMVTSDNSLEGIARNNLKMAGHDEVLVIINQKVEKPATKKHFWNANNKIKFNKAKKENNAPQEKLYIPEQINEE